MSNVQYYLEAIRQQTMAVNKITFAQVINSAIQDQTPEDIEEAWQLWLKEQECIFKGK